MSASYTLTAEDFEGLAEDGFKERGNAALSPDELDSVTGAVPWGLRLIVSDMRFRSQLQQARNRAQ